MEKSDYSVGCGPQQGARDDVEKIVRADPLKYRLAPACHICAIHIFPVHFSNLTGYRSKKDNG